jgi:chaperonin GroES
VAKTLKPFGDRVVIQRNKADEFFPAADGRGRSAIIKPDTAKKKEPTGTVIAVGPGKILDNGKLSEMYVKVGMEVVFNDYGYAPHPDMPETACVNQDMIVAQIIEK